MKPTVPGYNFSSSVMTVTKCIMDALSGQFYFYAKASFLSIVFFIPVVNGQSQNCNVDFPGTVAKTFSEACGSAANLTLGDNTFMGSGDTFTFDGTTINIGGNVNINVQGSAKIIIPEGTTVIIDGNFRLDSRSGECDLDDPCVFEIEVNGVLHIDGNTNSDLRNVVWTGSGTVIVDGNFQNANRGCMRCGPDGCPDFDIDEQCSDDGSGCANFCTVVAACASDVTAPAFTNCPADQTISIALGCSSAATWTPPTPTDNCSLASVESTHDPGFAFPKGVTTVTYTATDAAGNVASCSFKITVVDDLLPVILNCPADITVDANASCKAVVDWTPPAFKDNCTGGVLTSNKKPGSTFNIGTTVVTYTATDVAGNVSTCSFNINVVVGEHAFPEIENCPGDVVVEANADGTAVVSWSPPTATANCSTVTLTSSHSPGETFRTGTTPVEYKATDAEGKSTYCRFHVVVEEMKIDFVVSPAVTPDGDGVNDQWIVKNIENFPDNKVFIVDRWGGTIFSASGYDNTSVVWRGDNKNGGTAPTGTYFYHIIVQTERSRTERKGVIELIR